MQSSRPGICGLCRERKNVNLPGVVVDLPTLTAKDEEDLVKWGVPNDIDFIAASFVRKGSDLDYIRKVHPCPPPIHWDYLSARADVGTIWAVCMSRRRTVSQRTQTFDGALLLCVKVEGSSTPSS